MEAYPLTMAKQDETPVEARTYSVEEVGAIIRRATTAKAAPPTATQRLRTGLCSTVPAGRR